MPAKTCSKCGKAKLPQDFHKDSRASDKLYSHCKSCHRKYTKRHRQENKEYYKKYREENRKTIVEYGKKWREENREAKLEYHKKYYQENKIRFRMYSAERESRKVQATPPWLCRDLKKEMEEIYATCPEGYHVDHIVPIKGETVCGLHVPWNLQHLPAEENIAKGNRYWPDMWELEYG